MAKKRKWIVTTSPDRAVSAVAKDLAKAGFVVDQVLEEIGSITGSAPEGALAEVRAVRGVVDVSPDAAIDVGPPDSSTTW